jgi:hypothetical protein
MPVYKRTQDERLPNGSMIYWSRRRGEKVLVRCGNCGCQRWLYIQNATTKTFTGLCYECSRIALRKHTGIETLPNGSVIFWDERDNTGQNGNIPVKCGICGKVRPVSADRVPSTGFTGYCVDCARTGPRSHFWKNGRIQHQSGYILVRLTPDHPFYCMADSHHLVPEHRLIMAEHIGRPLRDNEIVHHKNGIKNDNRLENLELLHRHLHHTGFKPDEPPDNIKDSKMPRTIKNIFGMILRRNRK